MIFSRPRQKKRSQWRLFAFVLIHALIGLHLYAYYVLKWRPLGSIGLEELFRTFIQKGVLNVGALFFLCALVLGLFWGRLFCGWACHIGILYDLLDRFYARLPKTKWVIRSGWMIAFFMLFYLFIRPALLMRWLQPPDQSLQMNLAETAPWTTLPGWMMGLTLFSVVFLFLPLMFGRRAFCKILCPWGALFGLTNKFSLWKIRKVSSCSACGSCTQVCPMDIDVSQAINGKGFVDSYACTGCMMCLDTCDEQTLGFVHKIFQKKVLAEKGIDFVSLNDSLYAPGPAEGRPNQSMQWGIKWILLLGQPWCSNLFFAGLTILVGLVYSELYGIGHFLAFCIGAGVAWVTIYMTVYRTKVQPIIIGCVLVLIWSIVLKDGWAHYHYDRGLKAFQQRRYVESQFHLEQSDAWLWTPPTELFLKLYTIYKGTGQTEKQEAIRKRYDQRRFSKRKH